MSECLLYSQMKLLLRYACKRLLDVISSSVYWAVKLTGDDYCTCTHHYIVSVLQLYQDRGGAWFSEQSFL